MTPCLGSGEWMLAESLKQDHGWKSAFIKPLILLHANVTQSPKSELAQSKGPVDKIRGRTQHCAAGDDFVEIVLWPSDCPLGQQSLWFGGKGEMWICMLCMKAKSCLDYYAGQCMQDNGWGIGSIFLHWQPIVFLLVSANITTAPLKYWLRLDCLNSL